MRQIAKKQTSNSNLNKFASPTPVNLYGGLINGKKVFDISGNIWRHSVSVLTIMEGFKTDPFYNDFTLPTIDGLHNHILGGSWISLGNCANLNARYGFRRHFYQFAGIRYVCSDNTYHDKVGAQQTVEISWWLSGDADLRRGCDRATDHRALHTVDPVRPTPGGVNL